MTLLPGRWCIRDGGVRSESERNLPLPLSLPSFLLHNVNSPTSPCCQRARSYSHPCRAAMRNTIIQPHHHARHSHCSTGELSPDGNPTMKTQLSTTPTALSGSKNVVPLCRPSQKKISESVYEARLLIVAILHFNTLHHASTHIPTKNETNCASRATFIDKKTWLRLFCEKIVDTPPAMTPHHPSHPPPLPQQRPPHQLTKYHQLTNSIESVRHLEALVEPLNQYATWLLSWNVRVLCNLPFAPNRSFFMGIFSSNSLACRHISSDDDLLDRWKLPEFVLGQTLLPRHSAE